MSKMTWSTLSGAWEKFTSKQLKYEVRFNLVVIWCVKYTSARVVLPVEWQADWSAIRVDKIVCCNQWVTTFISSTWAKIETDEGHKFKMVIRLDTLRACGDNGIQSPTRQSAWDKRFSIKYFVMRAYCAVDHSYFYWTPLWLHNTIFFIRFVRFVHV